MREVAWLAVPVAFFILGVPLCHSISQCRQGRSVQIKLQRWWILCAFLFFFSILSGVVFGFAGVLLARFPVRDVRHSTHCKVLSKDVELRFAKNCSYGDLSPLSLKMFGVADPLKFRCFLDYYWVSVLKVEFQPYYSNRAVQLKSEVPKEALPSKCRPGFAHIWSLKENFEVNRSYPCLYTHRSVHFEIDAGSPSCRPESPSIVKLFRDYLVLVVSSYNLRQSNQSGTFFWRGIYALLIGLAYSLLVTAFTKAISCLYFRLLDSAHCSLSDSVFFEARLQISSLVFAVTVATILSTGLEELQLGFKLLAERKFDTQPLKNWLDKLLI